MIFLNYSDSKKLEIYNHKKIKLKFQNRFTKFIDRPEDIAIIKIKESDEIYKEVEFLNCDLNYMNCGYNIYKDADVFSVEHPGGEDASCASGKIKYIYNNEFEHDISTEGGS